MRFGASWVRRTVSVLLATFVLIVAPQVAHAAFSARTAPTMSVGTASLDAPDGVTGSRQCLSPRGLQMNYTGFDFEGPDGVVFRYSIYRGTSTTPFVTGTSTSRSVSISTRAQQSGSNVWRATISAELGNWTGPEWSRTYSC